MSLMNVIHVVYIILERHQDMAVFGISLYYELDFKKVCILPLNSFIVNKIIGNLVLLKYIYETQVFRNILKFRPFPFFLKVIDT